MSEQAIDLFARDLKMARRRWTLTVQQCAAEIGISTSALRRIECGKSRNAHGDTALAILAWAGHRDYRKFGGFSIEKSSEASA